MSHILIAVIPLYLFYVLFLGLLMLKKRIQAVREKKVKVTYFKDYQGDVPEVLKVYENHFNNQFQIPIIFFITCLASIQMSVVSSATIALAYGFFVSRIVHSFFHLGSNNIKYRALSYHAGFFLMMCIWVEIIIKIYP